MIGGAIAALLLAAGVPGASGFARAPSRPNLLFLLADDQRSDTIAALGNPAIRTPNLDGLVRRGFVFSNAYCLGSNLPAVCTPSRNMLLSGRAYFRWQGPLASGEEPNLPLSMRAAGYETYHHGKRGNTALRIQEKFEHNRYLENDDAERRSGEPGREIVDAAIRFLRDRKRDRPFCMYLAFANPHDPRVAAPTYLDLYRPDDIPLPKSFLPEHPFDNGELRVRDEQLAPWPRTPAEIRRQLRDYYAVITALDGHIGRLLQALRDQGAADDTVVVFSSDHGLALGSHGLMGKQNLYEHSMKVPLVFAGPGIPHGRSSALVYLLDLFPTFCDLAGAPVPPGLDGKSLQPLLCGRATGVRESLFLAYRGVQRAVRDERWKMIRYPEAKVTQLFDLKSDPDELRSLAGDPEQRSRIDRLLKLMREWQRQLGDPPLALPGS